MHTLLPQKKPQIISFLFSFISDNIMENSISYLVEEIINTTALHTSSLYIHNLIYII